MCIHHRLCLMFGGKVEIPIGAMDLTDAMSCHHLILFMSVVVYGSEDPNQSQPYASYMFLRQDSEPQNYYDFV